MNRQEFHTQIKNDWVDINNNRIFYREAGNREKPVVVLLHGYPSSSLMFKEIMLLLADSVYVLAPDMPGFGFTELNDAGFTPTFEQYALFLNAFLQSKKITKAYFYLFDYSAPIIMRVLTQNPELMQGLIFQNGIIHKEGMGEVLINARKWLDENTGESLKQYNKLFELDYTKWEYLNGIYDRTKIAPEYYMLDQYLLDRPQIKAFQIALKKDYRSNVELYPQWQLFLHRWQPRTLILWGKNDEVFTMQGAYKIHELVKKSELRIYDCGHFALLEYPIQISDDIKRFILNK
ncbi:MAG: alpha/beta hydrolase [Sediminibacterium magnilacihabitans]|jgi:pimeloyl-ACP methyl ester carboxylesterase|nr:alpha/beta hydrolase [Sediminibacterium magnilacihabitans]PQV62112.1 pimeloyl-ACP methyl ester carboxylesterase [Sediminibacterium magnilacihabitans]